MNIDLQKSRLPNYWPLPIKLILMRSETGLFINNLKSFLQNAFSCFSVFLTNSTAMSSHTTWIKDEFKEIS